MPSPVGKVSATDPDEGDGDLITYTIVDDDEDPDNNLFAIDRYGNITYTGTGEDAESETTSYELMVNATDGGASSDSMVTVTVTDANDNAPEFVFDEGTTFYTFTLAENTDGSETAAEVGTVSATDPDGDAVTYSIVDDLFAIDPDSGAITYVGTGEDYESAIKSHVLMVEASDGSSKIVAQATVNVENVNEAPVADAEMAIGTFAFLVGEENRMEVNLKDLFSDPDVGDEEDFEYGLSNEALALGWLHFSYTYKDIETETDDGETVTVTTVTGTLYGTPLPGSDDEVVSVAIVARDEKGSTGRATFDVAVDAENAVPTAVKLEITVRDGEGNIVSTKSVTTVTVDENDEGEGGMGAKIGQVTVTDDDSAGHPHGQHTFTFKVNGENEVNGEKVDDLFEITDDGTGTLTLKLQEGKSLNYEDYLEDDGKFTLTITATDKAVGAADEAGEDADEAGEDADGRGSVSQAFNIEIKKLADGDGPVANDIGDWFVTVDDDLDAEDVRKGEWLTFSLDLTGSDAAFTDEDGGDLYFEISVVEVDSEGTPVDGTSVDWLQIDRDTGEMTNVAEMLPERGVYKVTVTATDEVNDPAEASFLLAVALSDEDNRDNDTPDIRDVEEFPYTEQPGKEQMEETVATFSVRDDDVSIDPHPYGVLTVTLDATNAKRFKVEETGRDGDSVHYAISTKDTDELKVGPDGMDLTTPNAPVDYDKDDDEVDITVTVTDGKGETDEKVITIDIVDAADEPPLFQPSAVEGGKRTMVDTETMEGTTTVTVDQEETSKTVIVVRLSDAWEDLDTDDDDLAYEVDDSGLPSWITVYGPDDWEDVEEDIEDDIDEDISGPSGVRDRDQIFAIVIDRTAEDGENESLASASFKVTARDKEGHSRTETITIAVDDINVEIAEDDNDAVVVIDDDTLTGASTGSLTMSFDADLDPDLDMDDDAEPELVLYTWSSLAEDAVDDPNIESMMPTVIMVSSSLQSLPLDATGPDGSGPPDRMNDYIGSKIIATVQYYEIDPATNTFVLSKEYTDETDFIDAPEEGERPEAEVSFDLTTVGGGLSVAMTITGADSPMGLVATLQASEDGDSGWINVGSDSTLTLDGGSGIYTASLNVNEDADADPGDGGGLYYRVILAYDDGEDEMMFTSKEMIQLGTLADPTSDATTDIIGGEEDSDLPSVGESIRVNTGGEPADVQWQVSDDRGGWDDISTDLELVVDSSYAGRMLRAKVTYTAEDDPATMDVDETGWPIWVEYTETLTVGGDATNNPPAATETSEEIRVELPARPAKPATGDQPAQPAVVEVDTETVADLFFDPDSDDKLTYRISAAPVTVDADVSMMGVETEVSRGDLVYRAYETERDTTNATTARVDDRPDQTLAIDKDTGKITYITDMEQTHDGDATDGQGNVLEFTIEASDNALPTAGTDTAMLTVRVNVAPTAIQMQSVENGQDLGDAEMLEAPGATVTGTAILMTDDDDTDTDTDPDPFTVMDDMENDARKLADLDVIDENAVDDPFGTHKIVVSDNTRFEIRENETDDGNGSTWELWLKEGATFNYESTPTTSKGTHSVTVTATDMDGSGLSTKGVFSIQIMDEDTDVEKAAEDAKKKAEEDAKKKADDAAEEAERKKYEVPGLEDDEDENEEDGGVPDPEGANVPAGSFIDDVHLALEDDLLDSYVLAIDDIDVA